MRKPPKGVGVLFTKDAHDTFMGITGSRYRGMVERMKRKKLPDLDFTLDEFRSHVLVALGGKEDGFTRCRYCTGFFGLKEITADHAIPLSRGGSARLENIEYPCQSCNQQKSSMTPDEFLRLLIFLEKEIPLARQDVLSRLAKAVKLAAGSFAIQGVVNDLKDSGAWQAAQKRRTDAKKAKKNRLGKF